MIYGNMSSLFSKMEQYEKAIDYSLKTVKLREKVASQQEKSNVFLGLAVNHQKINKPQAALSYLKEAEKYVDTTDHYMMKDITGQYANIYSALDKGNLAFEYARRQMNHRDSLYSLDQKKQMDELSEKYEAEKKEQEIVLLSSQNELKEAQLTASRKISIILGLGIIGLVGLLYFLSKLNKKIRKSEEQKDILLKEIHHRVKNNLQVISALLTLQSKHLEDDKAISALEEGKGRVNSMALIHQDLYQHDNLKGVDAKEYIEKLTADLTSTYQVANKDIQLEADIDSIVLDVDTMIPLGLVLNELISNSIKYAFEKKENGIIKITLKERDTQLFLEIQDDGQGVDPTILESKSFGYSLVRSFARRLDAKLSVDNEDGLRVRMDISNFKKAA